MAVCSSPISAEHGLATHAMGVSHRNVTSVRNSFELSSLSTSGGAAVGADASAAFCMLRMSL